MIRNFVIFFALAIVLGVVYGQVPSQQPIIGVFTQDAEDFPPFNPNDDRILTYIASSYVKNLEMAGAQVVPLFYHYSEAQLLDLLGKINGAYFPGGSMSINQDIQWTSNTKFIVQYAKKQNDLGNNFPVWATCLGYYAVMFACTGGQTDSYNFLTRVTGEHQVVHPLIIYNNDSKLLKSFSQAEMADVTTGDGVYFFSHTWSIMLGNFTKYPAWGELFKVIATSKTSYGAEFISILEGKKYPFFMTQFHTEKNSFQWRVDAKRHYNAISAQQKIANTFVNEARKNKNTFPYEQMKKKLIYNYQPRLLDMDQYFVQVHIFDQTDLVVNEERKTEGKRFIRREEGEEEDEKFYQI